MPYQRIDSSRRAHQVAAQLREAIFGRRYKPGQRLPTEHELSDVFGVSRIIVREAVRDLEKSGLVAVKRGARGGAFVQEMNHGAVTSVMRDVLTMSRTDSAHIIEVRLELEPHVAGLAARRATEDDLGAMRGHLQAEPSGPGPEYVRWNVGFHRKVAHACHNPVYELLMNIVLDIAEDMILRLQPSDRADHDRHAHGKILAAIEKRDAGQTRQLFHDHLLSLRPLIEKWKVIPHSELFCRA